MSRLIVKNLPNGITEQRIRTLFGQKGSVTDVNLKYAKNGVFRKFAFVGYQTEEEAGAAKDYFNSTFIDTSKIQVEYCRNLGNEEKPRAWSQHSSDSSRFQAQQAAAAPAQAGKAGAAKSEDKKKPRESEDKFMQMMRNPLLTDEEKALLEASRNDPDFIEFFQIKNNKSVWNNDDLRSFSGLSAKMDAPAVSAPEEKNAGKEDFNKMKNSVKLKHLPKGVTKAAIREFFSPLNPSRVHLPKKAKDIAFVQFATKDDVKKAVAFDKKSLDSKTVSVLKCHDLKDEAEENDAEQDTTPEVANDPSAPAEPLAESGRLFVRNLPFTCTVDDLEALFGKFGPISEVKLPIDYMTQRCKGYGIITFMMPEHAVKALGLDGKDFRGRVIHVIPAQPKRDEEIPAPPVASNTSAFKKEKKAKLKSASQSAKTWNSLFLGTNAVMDVMAERYKVSKAQILESDGTKQSAAVRVALGETEIVNETREFLLSHGVKLDAFGQAESVRSKTVILVKNLPAGTISEELLKLFREHGTVAQLVLPPAGISALVEMVDASQAKRAFRALAYFKFGTLPLFLEWAPEGVLGKASNSSIQKVPPVSVPEERAPESSDSKASESVEEPEPNEPLPGATIFVKNLSFATVDDSLYNMFSSAGPVKSATVARKIGPKNEMLSMGYGFIEFKTVNAAKEALRTLQHTMLDGHKLELKVSERTVRPQTENSRKPTKSQDQTSAKIMVRNIPFQASEKEIRDIFRVFGELKSVRLPRKMGETGTHRGFCFIEYHSKKDAKRAFEALSHSTHLYSRRLVLEWADTDDQNVEILRHKVAEHFHDDDSSRKKLKKSHLYDQLDQSLPTAVAED